MTSFTKRLSSAVVGVAALIALWYYCGALGYQVLCAFATIIGGLELVRILFKKDDSKLCRVSFYLCLLGIYAVATYLPHHTGLAFSILTMAFCLINMFAQGKFENLEQLTVFEAKSIMGFFYLGLLPSFATRLLALPLGMNWFLTLLAIVFSGDIGAYMTGMMMGRHKLMPMISPKKTVEGAIGGLVFSTIVGVICGEFLGQPLLPMVLLSAGAAVVAQFGDLFESQLKRVANVKDSGRIMPGHGGVLDRIDGVLFASPVVLLGAYYLEGKL